MSSDGNSSHSVAVDVTSISNSNPSESSESVLSEATSSVELPKRIHKPKQFPG